jgi:predicted amidohydrolase YtcJ
MGTKILWVLSIFTLMPFALSAESGSGKATLAITNANIITMNPAMARAECVAARGEDIIYAGDKAGLPGYIDSKTTVIDLEGMTLVPGFNDDHTHTVGAGAYYMRLMLYGMSCEEIVEVVKEEVSRAGAGEPIQGTSWDFTTCPNPHKDMLDAVSCENPVILTQYGGHAAWVNSVQLEKMRITRDTPDPFGGQIDKDPLTGEPTGILRETAMGSAGMLSMAKDFISMQKHREVLEKSLELYREAGITSVQDNTWVPITVWILNDLKKEGRLTCRFTCWPYGQVPVLRPLMSLASYDETWVRKGQWKYFSDGAFSAHTAWMTVPYAGEPENYGLPRYTVEELQEIVLEGTRQRQQITFHAIGDRAVHEVVNAVELAQEKYPWTKDLRHRLEHIQIMLPEDIPRMARLGMVASVQPFAACNPEKDISILGRDRAWLAYPYKALLDGGVHVAFGSDVPAEIDYKPLLGIYYAVTRKNKQGTAGPINPYSCMSVEQALYCYTMGSAYAEFMEHKKGSIERGKLADFAVLAENPYEVEPEHIKDIEVLMTVAGGRVVYQK